MSREEDDALSEKVDLTLEQKKDILQVERELASRDHFSALGLTPGADVGEIKRAYYEASRKYHPDVYFSRQLGSYRKRLEIIFKRLSEAHAVLSDATRRAEYLKANPSLLSAQEAARDPQWDEKRASERRARLSRHPYLAQAASKAAIKGVSQAAAAAHQPASQKGGAHASWEETLARAKEAERCGNMLQAAAAYKAAWRMRPDSLEAAQKAVRVGLLGQVPAVELLPVAQKAAELAPAEAESRVLLGEVLLALGKKRKAKKELKAALKLTPEHQRAKAHLKKLRWTF
jgi:curved DNA-binding protein CbpA